MIRGYLLKWFYYSSYLTNNNNYTTRWGHNLKLSMKIWRIAALPYLSKTNLFICTQKVLLLPSVSPYKLSLISNMTVPNSMVLATNCKNNPTDIPPFNMFNLIICSNPYPSNPCILALQNDNLMIIQTNDYPKKWGLLSTCTKRHSHRFPFNSRENHITISNPLKVIPNDSKESKDL